MIKETNKNDFMTHNRKTLNIDHERSQSLPETIWEAIFDSIPDLITVIDKDCNIIRVNRAMANRLKRSEESLVGTHCFESIHGCDHPHEACPHILMLKDGLGHAAEIDEPLLGGVFMVSTTPIYNADGSMMGSVHIARDITRRKEAEDKLQEYNQELKELNASKDKFFSVIAHDLKSPFQGLLGFTDLLIDDLDILKKDEIRNYLIKIKNASDNTYSLLENLLDWSRLQTGRMPFNPVKFDISEEIYKVFETLNSNAIRKGISLSNLVNHGLEVEADQNMIHSIIQNLVSNAIKFSYSSAQVVVTSGFLPFKELYQHETCDCERKFLKINVQDNGIGIPDDALPRILSLTDHFTLNGTANEPGTGLGLILSKEMVERHGGELSVTSTQGYGSTFSFTIPVS